MEDPCSWGYYTVACLHVMWGRWRCDVLSKVTTWHELHENCKVWCTQVGWWGEFCCIVLKAGCNEKCRGWEFSFIWQISKMWSRRPLKRLGVKGLEWFPWAHASALHGWGKNAPWIYLFFSFRCFVVYDCYLLEMRYLNVFSVTLAMFALTWLWIGTEWNWALITFQI